MKFGLRLGMLAGAPLDGVRESAIENRRAAFAATINATPDSLAWNPCFPYEVKPRRAIVVRHERANVSDLLIGGMNFFKPL
jgi:hypothetical protein